MDSATPAIVIFLIEDEGIIRMGTAAILGDAGYRVIEATTAVEALEILQEHPEISLVVTDVQMPGKTDGLELVKIIGRNYPKIRTLVTSGRTSFNEARQCGAKRFLPKPYSAPAIQSIVEAILTG